MVHGHWRMEPHATWTYWLKAHALLGQSQVLGCFIAAIMLATLVTLVTNYQIGYRPKTSSSLYGVTFMPTPHQSTQRLQAQSPLRHVQPQKGYVPVSAQPRFALSTPEGAPMSPSWRQGIAQRAVAAVLTGAAVLAGGAFPSSAALVPPAGDANRPPQVSIRGLTESGMQKFTKGDVQGSIEDFDRIIAGAPRMEPYMWQRGLSLYYAEELQEGSRQFRRDVAVNPNDTEEAIWAFLCEARDPSIGFEKARTNMLQVGRDSRPYMRAAYDLFRGTGTEEGLKQAAVDGPSEFYSNLYLGLYAEAKGDSVAAQQYISAAVNSPYRRSGDYMYALAVVHKNLRGW
uniref:Uncharacterized protein n=1 Tax=Eutreptiella gymnastica TaxID=73025 RepID=A0A7S1JEY7_9EUGL